GPATITKSVVIDGNGVGSVINTTGTGVGITFNGGASDYLVLRNLSITATVEGVRVNSDEYLLVDNTRIFMIENPTPGVGWTGIRFCSYNSGALCIPRSTIFAYATSFFAPTSCAKGKLSVWNSAMYGNIRINAAGGSVIKAALADSIVAGTVAATDGGGTV